MKSRKEKLYEVIFEADTPLGRWFDIVLLFLILLSITFVMLESVAHIREKYIVWLDTAEWIITIFFTIEYIIRIIIVRHPLKYIFSFYGLIDLISVLPTYLEFMISGANGLIVIRALRMLRLFRILNLSSYVNESHTLFNALIASRKKISVFLFSVLMIIIIIGTIMYLVESPESGFTSIPRSVYWAVVTLTTVGYGDIAPITPLGQFIAGLVMILGYAIIAVPTGIVTAEISAQRRPHQFSTKVCPECLHSDHEKDADFCYKCGTELLHDDKNQQRHETKR